MQSNRHPWKAFEWQISHACAVFKALGPHGFHEIAYTEWGNPNASRLVFCVHGFTRNSRDFDALAASLADSCHVVCMDVACRGQSEWLAV